MRPVSKLHVGTITLNRFLQRTRVEGHVSFVETFSMMKNSHFTDIDYAAHRSPQFSASKLNKMIDLNRNYYIRNMYIDLLNLLRLIK